MKIAIWNLMRPNAKTIERNQLFLDKLKEAAADIIILTETNSVIQPEGNYHSLSSAQLVGTDQNIDYKQGECRVEIFSRYPFVRQIQTTDPSMSVCGEVETPYGPLIVYGTVIGDLGGRGGTFKEDFETQSEELTKLVKQGNVLLGGDLNISFPEPVYPSHDAADNATTLFKNLSLTNLTKHFPNNAIHCVICSSFIKNKNIQSAAQGLIRESLIIV